MKILERYKARNEEKRAYYQNLMKRCLSEPVTQEQQKQASQYYQLYQNTSSLSSSCFQLYNHKHSHHNAKIALDSVCSDQLYKALDRIFVIGIDFMTSHLRAQLAQCIEFFSQRASIIEAQILKQIASYQYYSLISTEIGNTISCFIFFIIGLIIVFSILMAISLEIISTANYAYCHIHGMFIAPAYYSLSNIKRATLRFPQFMSPVVRFILTQFLQEQSISNFANQMTKQWFFFLFSLGFSIHLMILLIIHLRKSVNQKVKYKRAEMILKEKSNEAKINGEFLRKLDWVVNKNV